MIRLEKDFVAIYETMMGDSDRVPWVRDAGDDDTDFARGYEMLWKCRERLADRLGIEDFAEDADLEAMMDAVCAIQKDLCRRMFYCTIRYAVKGYKL